MKRHENEEIRFYILRKTSLKWTMNIESWHSNQARKHYTVEKYDLFILNRLFITPSKRHFPSVILM